MKKTTKISVLALFALSFALVLGGCKNSTTPNKETDDPNVPQDTPQTVKTRYTSDSWVKKCPANASEEAWDGESKYPGFAIKLSDMDLDENLSLSDYDYVKINITYLKENKEVTNDKGVAKIEKVEKTGDSETTTTLSFTNFVNSISSDYASAWLPIKGVVSNVSDITRFYIQCNNTNSSNNFDYQVDTIKVNYIEFVKIPDLKKGVSASDSYGNYVEQIVKAGEDISNGKVVFAIAFSKDLVNYGLGKIVNDTWVSEDVNIVISFDVDEKGGEAGDIQDFIFSYADVKKSFDADYKNINIWGGGALQYVYIK